MSKEVANAEQQCLTLSGNAAIIPALLDVEEKERKIARQVVWLQFIVTLTVASIVYSTKVTPQSALAVLCGGGVSVVNGGLLAWRMSRSALYPPRNVYDSRAVHQQLRLLFFYATERFLVVIVLLGLCIVVLKLPPLAFMAGFVMSQATLLVARLLLSKVKTKIVTKNV